MKLRKYLIEIVGCSPYMFVPLYRIFGQNKRLLVNERTDIVIEGYPRSGNTFSVLAFQYAQKDTPHIAHHLHASAQVIWAVKKSIPVVVLIREPIDAILSFVIRDKNVGIDEAIKQYIRFYKSIIPYINDIVIAEFDTVISDYGKIIRLINEKYLSTFEVFNHTTENEQKVLELVQKAGEQESNDKIDERTVARPSVERTVLKEKILPELMSSRYTQCIKEAQDLYSMIISEY
ncbi:MAG: hypothetical protein JAZ12_02945 [Candidatus Thiodiazotropha taylori]|nr:hypothetical protein [Candidatus Thiodiazotropha taylori]